MVYRTKTYIAGDWTGDKDAIDKLYSWKKSDFYNLDFVDAHEFHQSNDKSFNCSIKDNLRVRMEMSLFRWFYEIKHQCSNLYTYS